MNALIEQNLVA